MTLPGSADTTSMLKDSVHSVAVSVASVRLTHCGSLRAVRVTLSDEVGSKSFGNAVRVYRLHQLEGRTCPIKVLHIYTCMIFLCNYNNYTDHWW